MNTTEIEKTDMFEIIGSEKIYEKIKEIHSCPDEVADTWRNQEYQLENWSKACNKDVDKLMKSMMDLDAYLKHPEDFTKQAIKRWTKSLAAKKISLEREYTLMTICNAKIHRLTYKVVKADNND